MNFISMNLPSMTENDKDNQILTMAFVNMQPLDTLYETERGWSNGTIFPNLNKPFEAGGMVK